MHRYDRGKGGWCGGGVSAVRRENAFRLWSIGEDDAFEDGQFCCLPETRTSAQPSGKCNDISLLRMFERLLVIKGLIFNNLRLVGSWM